MVVAWWGSDKELLPTVRNWLPKLLPRFNELGLVRVWYHWD